MNDVETPDESSHSIPKKNKSKTSTNDIAYRIEINIETVADLWEQRVQKEIEGSHFQEPPALRENISGFLEQIVKFLSTNPELTKAEILIEKAKEKKLAKNQGHQRALMPEYTLEQVILEFNILNDVLFEIIDPQNKMTLKQGRILLASSAAAIKSAVIEFSKIRTKAQDVSYANLSNKMLQQSKDTQDIEINYKQIIDSVGDFAIFTLDPTGIITSWNLGATRMKGYSSEEAIGKNFSMLYPKESILRNEPQAHLVTAKQQGRYRGEGVRLRKSGEEFMSDVYIIPLRKENQVIGFAKIIQDMTEHNKLVQERDLSVSEASELKIEQKMRESFVSTLTHDLRTPLAAAKMSAQLILRNINNEDKLTSFASKIIEHISRTDKMITDLLDANRIKAGRKIPLNLAKCNLTKLVHDLCDDLSTVHGSRLRVASKKEVQGTWDAAALTRILENLIMNALKYGEAASVVTVLVEQVKNRVHIKVHNFGKVIELPEQGALFDQFHRTPNAEEGSAKGWGLGLTLVKGLVEAHEGMVKVESYPGKGTTFTVDLPLNKITKNVNNAKVVF